MRHDDCHGTSHLSTNRPLRPALFRPLSIVRAGLQLLGPVSARRLDGRAAPPLTAPRRLGVLAYLAIARPHGLHARDTLAALFWPESDPASARHGLRNVLTAVRRALGDPVIVTSGDGLVGVDTSHLECDVRQLRDDLANGRVEEAFARLHGELMQGFHAGGASDFEDWLDAERRHLRDEVLEAARCRIAACRMAGDVEGALAAARRANEFAPDDERVARRLLESLEAVADLGAAEQVFQRLRERLAREYGTQPSAESVVLMHRIRSRRGNVTPAPRPRSSEDAEAYVLCVRGTYLFLRNAANANPEELARCRELFEQALARNPAYASAVSGLANYYALAAARDVIRPFTPTFARAIALSHEALALDPAQSIPHVHFGVHAMYLDGDFERADVEFSIAAALDPSYAEARRFLGICRMASGRAAAGLDDLRAAALLEPQMPTFRNSLGAAYMDVGRRGEAIAEFRAALALDARYGAARERLVRCLEREGQYDEAVAERRRGPNSLEADAFERALRRAGPAGYRQERERELQRLLAAGTERLRAGPPENGGDILIPPELRLALACAELGDMSAALAWAKHAIARRPGQRQWFVGHPDLAPIRAALA